MVSISHPHFIGIIPARYGSSRFPGKPLSLISGKSLIQRTYENSLRFKELSDVVVATDDLRIAEHVAGFGGKVVMTAEDCPTGTDRMAEVVKRYPQFSTADYYINLQGDAPCVDPELITKVCGMMAGDPSAVMGTAAIPLKNKAEALKPSTVKCLIDLNGYALYFSRALIPVNITGDHDSKAPYYVHVGVYCFKRDFLLRYTELPQTPLQKIEDLEQLKVLEHGYRIKVAVLSQKSPSPSVDYPEDIKKVEELLCSQNTYLSQAASFPL